MCYNFIMEFKEVEQTVLEVMSDYADRHNITIDKDFAVTKLFEEVGEYAQAVLIHQKKCRKKKLVPEEISKAELAKELADVVGLAMVNANLFDIDLEDAINRKWMQRKS